MFNKGYESVTWSDEEHHSLRDWKLQGLSLGAVAAAGGLGFTKAITPDHLGTRPIDKFSAYTRTAGNLSPFQILNTFRVPEWVSPFTSPEFQGMTAAADGSWSTTIDKSFLKEANTYDYLKKLTGLDDSALRTKGITPRAKGVAADLASELIFEKAKVGDISGRLYSNVAGQRHLLSSNVMLGQFSAETASVADILAKSSPVNKVMQSVFAAMNMWEQPDFNPNKVFSSYDYKTKEITRPKFIPIPGFDVSTQGTSYLRALPSFSAGRFNQLLSNIGAETFGPGFESLTKRLGVGLNVTPGPASHMYARFGMKAGAVLGAGLVVAESDWLRRQLDIPGQAVVSAGLSFGIGALATRAGFGAKAGLFMGVASFAGQMILPGFDQGVIPGIATTYALGTQARASAVNPFNYYRRTLEGFLPGVSDPSVGIGIGLGAALMPLIKVPGTGQTIPSYLLTKYGHATFGMAKESKSTKVLPPKSTRDHFWDMMLDWGKSDIGGKEVNALWKQYNANGKYVTSEMRTRLTSALYGEGVSSHQFSKVSNSLWSLAEDRHKTMSLANPVNWALQDKLSDISQRYSGKSGFMNNVMMQGESLFEQTKHSFFGADVLEDGMSSFMSKKGFKSFFGRTGLVFGAAFLSHQVLTGGLLGSMESSEDLRQIYSGEQLVEVNKGRGWELGGSRWTGSEYGQFRPHWYPLMMNRTRQAGTWGYAGEEDRRSPITKFFLENFTYQLERETYHDRPYPVSSAAFSSIPIIGPTLSATVGQIFKPARLMHTNEWIQSNEGRLEFASTYQGWKREPSYNLGARDPGIPMSPFDPRSVYSDLNTQLSDLSGLTGYAGSTLLNMITGEDTLFSETPRLAEAGMMTSYRKQFWDMSLGGGGPIGEIVRRALPSVSKDMNRRNPLINTMPSWLPKEFTVGDPMSRMAFGEASLPGPGYVSLHPELEGLDPENYPLIYRYDILAQIAPKSKQLRKTRDMVYMQRAAGNLNAREEAWVDRLDPVVRKQWEGYQFNETADEAIRLPGSGLVRKAWNFSQRVLREGAAPIEYLVPGGFRPVQKFLGDRGMIEQYEWERMQGSSTAFWDKPFRDFIRPSLYSLAKVMGIDSKPAWRKSADKVSGYFDEMEFYKWMTLAEQARDQGEVRRAIQYEYQAANTRMGVNPQGSPLSIYWSIPNEDRRFFNSFAFAQGKDRNRILEMVPKDQTHLYKALWSRVDEGDPSLWAGSDTSPDSNYLYSKFYSMNKGTMPRADWIGMNADVDLRDIKVRYVDSLAADMHDYQIWESELGKAYSQPFLEGSEQFVSDNINSYRGAITQNLAALTRSSSIASQISAFRSNAHTGNVQLDYNDNRYSEISDQVSGYMNNGQR